MEMLNINNKMNRIVYLLLLFTSVTSNAQDSLLYDCLGNEVTGIESWIGDGFCDDGAYSWNGYDVYFNCPEFNFDNGDCPLPILDTIFGCMNFLALNYVPEANFEDGSCIIPIFGCMDPDAVNYNPLAEVDNGSCASVSCDDGEVKMLLEVTLDQYPGETGWILTDISNGQPVANVQAGEYSYDQANTTIPYQLCVPETGVELILSDTYGDGIAGSLFGGAADGDFVILGDLEPCGSPDTIWVLPDPNFGDVVYSGVIYLDYCDIPLVEGCMDPNYVEFNSQAVISDSSCVTEHIVGCTNYESFNYDSVATLNDVVDTCSYKLVIEDDGGDGWGESHILVTQGQTILGVYTMGPGEYNQVFYIDLATDKPVKVRYFEVGGPQQPPQEVEFQTMHNSFYLFNSYEELLISGGTAPFANNGAGALQSFEPPFWTVYEALPYCGDYCIDIVEGCMEYGSLNYDSLANVDSGNCIEPIYGCTNGLAFNYDSLANVDDGGCESIVYGCMEEDAWNYNYLANTPDESCLYFGCMDPLADNYNPIANVELDGACFTTVLGCTDPNAFNYNAEANTDDFSCIEIIYGCIDSSAFNYDPLANTSNDGCLEIVEGCLDSEAYNYDEFANTENGGCLYDAGCIDGPGNPYWLNDTCYAWVIMVDSYCCNTEWDDKCQELYWKCGGNSELDVRDLMRTADIAIYPVPMDNEVNILTKSKVSIRIYDLQGKLIKHIREKQTIKGLNTLNVKYIPSGLYNISITYDNKTITKQVVKR
tara:strand:+ start:990 stop:3278 length:2289 start_codon:yes stop_codon:yes gene_type:complete